MSFGGRGRGFGTGGAGRGSFGVSDVSSGSNGGFGGFGLSSAAPAAGTDDGWNDAPASKSNGEGSNGFGNESSNGGFGSSSGGGGFGSSSGGGRGFGSSSGGGGGFKSAGGGGGGSRACFKCGEEGHMSRECPSGGGGGGGGGSRACFKCGEEGHMSRECPSGGGGGGGGGSRACFKCGEEGHMSRECPSGGGGGGGGGSRACFKCGEEGHMSRECPSGGGGGGGGGGSRACFKCGEEGHMSRECPSGGGSSSGGFGGGSSGGGFGNSSGGGSSSGGFGGGSGGVGGSSGGFGGSSGGGGGGDSGCRNCGQDGHFARECPEPKKGGDGCRNCGEDGHFARECPNPRKPQGACRTCNEEGHFSKECPQNEGKPPPENYVPPEVDESEEAMFSSIDAGINFDKYDDIPVEISGNNTTEPIPSFAEAGLLDTVASNVKKAKYFKPTPIQKYAIPAIMAGRDLMGCAQTGSGKTAAFLLPVITGLIQKGLESGAYSPIQEPQALVIAPTRELVVQIYNECKKFSMNTIVRCVRLYGGTSTMHQMNDLSKGAHIIVATPGRLLDFIGRQKIGLGKLQYLILDEADRMLDMGFEPEMRRLVETMGMPGKTSRQTLMFSATFPAQIQLLAKDFLNDYIYLTVGIVGGANQDVKQAVLEVPQFEKREKLLEILREHPNQKTLVFVELKRNADFLASMLSQSEFATTSIHGDRLQREREQALTDFKCGVAPILVATSVAARGLDIKGVDHVVNYDLPKEIDEYVHRIGRTGRCGNLGTSTSFYDSESNADLARELVRCLAEAHQIVPEFLEKAADRGGGGGRGGKNSFGGRDNRAGGDTGAWDERPGGAAPAAADDDESWD